MGVDIATGPGSSYSPEVGKQYSCHEKSYRFKDPPPADMEPDKDYEPQENEWFWWFWKYNGTWILHHRTDGDNVFGGPTMNRRNKFTDGVYRHKMLPAVPPE